MSIVTPKKPRRQAKSVDSWEKFSRWSSGNDDTIDEILTSLDSLATELRRLINASTGVVGIGPHGSTHLPNGSDPISTAIAGSILPDDTAAVGTANFLSRSDHRHAITTDVPTIFGNAASEGVATAFSRSDHVHLWPDRLRENTNGQTVILTDNGSIPTLSSSRNNLTLSFSAIPGTFVVRGTVNADDGGSVLFDGSCTGPNFAITNPGGAPGVTTDWYPFLTNSKSIGTSLLKWKDGWFTGTITAGTFSGTFTLGAGNFAAPAFTFGTTNVDGVATTAVRSDSTLAIFDATVPADLASAAATGSAAFAARRDHVHLFPTTLRTAASGLELVATDSLGAITLTAPGSLRLVTGGNIQLVDNTAITGTLSHTAGATLATSSGDVVVGRNATIGTSGDLVPNTTNKSQLGTVTKRWADFHTVIGSFTGDLSMGAGTTINADNIVTNSISGPSASFDALTVNGAGGFQLTDVSSGSALLTFSIEGALPSGGQTLTLDVQDASRTLTLTGNPTIADWFNQSVKTTASPTFAALTITDAGNIALGTTTGTKFGTATTQKIGFFNKAPVVQPAAYTPTNVTTDRSYDANATTTDELADVLGTLIADLQSLGLIG